MRSTSSTVRTKRGRGGGRGGGTALGGATASTDKVELTDSFVDPNG